MVRKRVYCLIRLKSFFLNANCTDAGIRQILKEGWVHHIIRNAMACFLTRGDLWISWEDGLTFFSKNLIDFDWYVRCSNRFDNPLIQIIN